MFGYVIINKGDMKFKEYTKKFYNNVDKNSHAE